MLVYQILSMGISGSQNGGTYHICLAYFSGLCFTEYHHNSYEVNDREIRNSANLKHNGTGDHYRNETWEYLMAHPT